MTTSEIPSVQNNTNSVDVTGLAVAIGRIEEGQKYLTTGINEVKTSVGGLVEAQNAQGQRLAKIEEVVNSHDRILLERAPIRVPWTGIGAFIISLGALGVTLFGLLKAAV
jgi:hypothetical protein